MLGGYIKLHRQLIDWEWYSDTNVCRVFVHLLLTANFKDGNWRGQGVKRGQVIIGKESLGKTLGLSIQQVKTVFKKLKKTGEISTKATNRFVIVTICNFDSYQDKEAIKKEVATNKQPTSNQQTTNKQPQRKNVKKVKKEKNKEEVKKPLHKFPDNTPRKAYKVDAEITHTADTARELIFSKFGGATNAVKNVNDEYKRQTGFKIDALVIQTAIASFLQRGMIEYYTNLTRDDQVISKLMSWITNQVKHNRVDDYIKKEAAIEKLDYENYFIKSIYEEHPSPKNHLAFLNKKGIIKNLVIDFNSKSKEMQSIKEKYFSNYKNVSIYTIYDVIHTPLSKTITGGTIEQKMTSLKRFVDDLSDYLRNQGNIRSLLQKARAKQYS